jgi:hypothetical protein
LTQSRNHEARQRCDDVASRSLSCHCFTASFDAVHPRAPEAQQESCRDHYSYFLQVLRRYT